MCRRASKQEAPFPWRQCIVLALCNAAHFYTICSLFSYAGFLVVDLGWAADVDGAGYVAGYLGSALVVGRLFTSVLWGHLADKCGRKPAILLSMAGILIGNLAFGVTKTLHSALAARAFFLGACNGWVSLMGVYVGEVGGASRQNRVNGYTLTGGTFTQLAGPAVAALLYNKIPAYPALAPSLLGALLAFLAICLGTLWLTETNSVNHHGVPGLTDAFGNTLWYARRLGAAAARGDPFLARQSLVGFDYSLLGADAAALAPRPLTTADNTL